MYIKGAPRGMFTHDGAGRPELTGEVEAAVERRLEARGIELSNTPKDEYDNEFESELNAMIKESNEDYDEPDDDY